MCIYIYIPYIYIFILLIADNGLSFIETSALDSSNVELAFQRILTGNKILLFCRKFSHLKISFFCRNLSYCIKQGT